MTSLTLENGKNLQRGSVGKDNYLKTFKKSSKGRGWAKNSISGKWVNYSTIKRMSNQDFPTPDVLWNLKVWVFPVSSDEFLSVSSKKLCYTINMKILIPTAKEMNTDLPLDRSLKPESRGYCWMPWPSILLVNWRVFTKFQPRSCGRISKYPSFKKTKLLNTIQRQSFLMSMYLLHQARNKLTE